MYSKLCMTTCKQHVFLLSYSFAINIILYKCVFLEHVRHKILGQSFVVLEVSQFSKSTIQIDFGF